MQFQLKFAATNFYFLIFNFYFLLFLPIVINSAGRNNKFVKVAITSVSDVSHPNAWVPPNPLKQKMINPAIRTNEV
jgi:hypothetical protein